MSRAQKAASTDHSHVTDDVTDDACASIVMVTWQVCAAKGGIPGQNSKKIVFGKKPSELNPNPNGGKPLGTCGGWVPAWLNNHHCRDNYATDDIFFLEICMFNQICRNGEDLWDLEVGQEWECDFDEVLFDELADLLLTPATDGYEPGQGGVAAVIVEEEVDDSTDPDCELPGDPCDATCAARKNIRAGCARETNGLRADPLGGGGAVVEKKARAARQGKSCKWCTQLPDAATCDAAFFVDLWLGETGVPAVRRCAWDANSGTCSTEKASIMCNRAAGP